MPDAKTHDTITLASGAAIAPAAYLVQDSLLAAPPALALSGTAWLVGAHLLSGMLFSPDLDIDSAIDNRWGIFFWIWRPYMWLIPHRAFWSHSLIVSPILRLVYFAVVVALLLSGAGWLLGQGGIELPDLSLQAGSAVYALVQSYPYEATAFIVGFCLGSAAHTIADYLVTGGKRFLRTVGVTVRRDYSNHDRYVRRRRR
jgi:uncharacterized metal-binding protein